MLITLTSQHLKSLRWLLDDAQKFHDKIYAECEELELRLKKIPKWQFITRKDTQEHYDRWREFTIDLINKVIIWEHMIANIKMFGSLIVDSQDTEIEYVKLRNRIHYDIYCEEDK